MGTRYLTCVFQNGDYKIAHYGSWGEIAENQHGEVLIAMHYDSRRFQPYGYSEKENISTH